MAFFPFKISFGSATRNSVEQDKLHYQGFVLGLAFESLGDAGGRATHYADRLEQGLSLPDDWIDQLIGGYTYLETGYGIMLEQHEEETLKKLVQSDDISSIIKRLRELEAQYEQYYREQVVKRVARSKNVLNEAAERTGFSMQHDTLDDLTKALTQRQIEELRQPVERVREQLYPAAIKGFETITYNPAALYIKQNGGNDDSAQTLWWDTLEKLFEKIRKGSENPQGYRWYSIGKETAEAPEIVRNPRPAKMSTFFHLMIRRAWLTERRKKTPATIDALTDRHRPVDFIASLDEPPIIERVEEAIRELGKPCEDIIRLHWIEQYSLEEVAGKLGRSYGSVRNLHPKCLQTLTELFLKKH